MTANKAIDIDELMDFLLETSKDLIECGCSSNRVENLIGRIAEPLGVSVDALAMPTGVWLKVTSPSGSKVDLIRIRSWSVNLDRLNSISDAVDELENGTLTLAQAEKKIRAVSQALPPYNALLTVLAGGFAALTITFFLGGNLLECGLAFIPGAAVQYLTKYALTGENRRYVADFLASFLVGLYAVWCDGTFASVDAARIIVGAIIGLLPGLVLVNAVHELAQKNLLSGAAKTFESLIIAASLSFGILLSVGLYLTIMG